MQQRQPRLGDILDDYCPRERRLTNHAVVASVVDGLTLNRERAAAAASGLLLATDVADYLVGRGVPFRRSHEIVGALVRKLVADGRSFESMTIADWRAASELFDEDVVARVTPEASVAAKRTPQSTAPGAVKQALAEVEAWLASLPLEKQLC